MTQKGSARSGILYGLIMIAAGTVLLLERFDLLDTNLLRHFWPVTFIVLGAMFLLGPNGPFGKALGVFLVVIGSALELEKLGIYELRFRQLWPLYLIALGGFLVWRAIRPPRTGRDAASSIEGRLSEFAIFGGVDKNVASPAFEGGNLLAAFGGHDIDLTGSTMANGSAVLYAEALFGGIEIKVPNTWRVTVQGPAIFGGFENNAMAPESSGGADPPHLIIKGFAMFGGVSVKN